MMPVYRYVDSNPHHQRNQQHCFPGFEAVPVPPHLQQVDPSKPPNPMMYESFPCNTNYGYYVPYHGCCNHGCNYFPGHYSFRPPFPQFAPSPAFHHYPNYPTFPEAYPAYYAPPPHYSNEQPRYEYDKDSHANYHCCGCPTPYSQKPDRSLKIEEQEPDAERKGDSVVPIQPRGYPYPIVWIPPEYMKSKETGRRNDQPKASDWDKVSSENLKPNSYPIVWIPPECMKNEGYGKCDDQPEVNDWDKLSQRFVQPSKSSKPTEQQPRVWNGWFPLDMNGSKKSENQQKEDKMRQFPFPIFWMPYDGKREEDENQDTRKMITAPDHSKQAPVSSEFIPVEPSVHDARMEKPQLNKEISDNETASEAMGKTATKKCIPVKQMEVPRDDKSEGNEKRGRDASVKLTEDSMTKELGGTTAKRKSSPPSKTSKLPPVCLRVDPLPKKRNGNGSSRSPSPPKAQLEDKLTKASTGPGLKEDFAINAQDSQVEPVGKEGKNIQVMEENSMRNKAEECTNASHAQTLRDLPLDLQQVSEKLTTRRSENDGHDIKTGEENDAGSEEVVGAEKEADTMKVTNPAESAHGQCKAEIKRMSDVEAAKIIQSAYRGFEVRKWEPLKKLKQIAKVREQVDEVRNRIQALESSSDLDKDDRQRLLIGEIIMNLLLKLDTIQVRI